MVGEYRRATVIVGLDVSSEELDTRIRRRTEQMFACGVVDEVRNALEGRVSRTAEKALGLSELSRLCQTKLSSASSFGRGAMPLTRGNGCAGFRASS